MEWDISAVCVSVIMLNIIMVYSWKGNLLPREKPGLSRLSFDNLSLHSDKYPVNAAADTAFRFNVSHQSGAATSELYVHSAYVGCIFYLYIDYCV